MERINAEQVHKNRVIISLSAIILGFIIIVGAYFINEGSRVYRVAVFGNDYLKDSYIKELSQVEEGDIFYLVGLNRAADKIKKSPFIESVKVERTAANCISITVKEKKIFGYVYEELPYFVTAKGEKIEISEDMVYLISVYPYISEIPSEEVLMEIAKSFDKLELKTIKEISEIRTFAFSYDENNLELVMRDGNYLYVSMNGLKSIENYHLIVSNLETNNKCIFFEDVTNSAYTSDCPRIKFDKPVVDKDGESNGQLPLN